MPDGLHLNVTRSQTTPSSQMGKVGKFQEINQSAKNLIAKYIDTRFGTPSTTTKEKIERFNKLWDPLEQKYRENPSEREEILKELERLHDELLDTLTRSPSQRKLTVPNRLDSPQEQVKEEIAKTKERIAENAKKAEEIKKRWDSTPGLEMRFRLLNSNGQGNDTTIQNSAKELLGNFNLFSNYLVYVAPNGAIKETSEEINKHLLRNDLSENTKKLLRELSKKLGF